MATDRRRRRQVGKVAILVCAGAAAVAAGSAADGNAARPGTATIVFTLKEAHRSGVSGTATITRARKGVRVVLRVEGQRSDALLAHIHTGPCRREPTFADPRIYSSLNSVVSGRSVTHVTSATLASLQAKTFSINVHSPQYTTIACGDVPRAAKRGRR